MIRSQDRLFILWGMADDPTWPGWNPSVASSRPAMSRIVVARLAGPGARLHEGRDDVEVERARVHLPDVGERGLEAEVARRRPPRAHATFVGRAEEVEHVLLRADRALDAAQRVAGEQLLDAAERLEQLLAGVGEPLAHRGGLRGDVVAATGHHERGVLGGPLGQPGERGDHPVADERRGPLAPAAARRSR